eukprot:TRINITY_DN12135_c0_g1_i10.p2 TRINITY_DN12135_c0_g1~~TRINITY_DN12135_c0_g1_i10.p2  ORF type:complete len:438 (-),score=112.37 TRINITY_DN12135_c0_g1_i10:61-1374(-)
MQELPRTGHWSRLASSLLVQWVDESTVTITWRVGRHGSDLLDGACPSDLIHAKVMRVASLAVVAAVLCATRSALALNNGLGLTPAMGWNSWNKFGCNVSETLIKAVADRIVDLGLKDLGYEYVNIDDCWQVSRDSNGVIVVDSTRFPNGMKALADYVHSKGLKFGVYSDAGLFTCQMRPGGLGHEKVDAQTYAEWGVDYLKYDNCFNMFLQPQPRYTAMRDALVASGRPIYFSLCEWGQEDPATWAADVGNSWRTTNDISDNWDSMTSILDQNDKWAAYAGPGHWNDPDMLEVGNGGMTFQEYKAHFSLWALMKAPLLIGCDLDSASAETLAILKNKEVIAVNQDPLGIQGTKLHSQNSLEVWAGVLQNKAHAVVLFNRSPQAANMSLSWSDLGLASNSSASVRDLWAHEDLGTFQGSFSAIVESHSVVMILVRPRH